ncbi:MAG: hypothetical protein LBS82_01795 [Spirochaetaceae bacterium]|jgi:hypothetical protein|nr:hypothetical protein [Spirochaetaceae bacterium]
MEPKVVCKPSAFKHGCSFEDIEWAFATARYDGMADEKDESKRLLIGFDSKGNPLEVLYNESGDNTMNVFHAMACGNANFSLLTS